MAYCSFIFQLVDDRGSQQGKGCFVLRKIPWHDQDKWIIRHDTFDQKNSSFIEGAKF